MGKVKNKAKRKSLSEKALKPIAMKKKVMNPFEVHVNRQKHDVLGRKTKNDKGLPGVARAKAISKRKKTLLQEFKIKDKSNQFLDRRIGEKNRAMTSEDRIMARFTAERMKMHNKKSIFNLADDEVLTHRGQTLSEIEKFDDPRSDDEEEEEKLDSGFVEDAHFGGGILKKSNNPSSRKDLIEQLITESKKRKAEKQRAREQTIQLTEKLDTEWKDLLPIVSASKKSASDVVDEDSKPDSYDTVMRQLKFEARGKPSDKLKSEEEIAKEEKERLEQLEAERLKRMRGFKDEIVTERKHKSADDLDDGFEIETDEEVLMTYNSDGQLENPLTDTEKDENDEEMEDHEISEEENSEKEDKVKAFEEENKDRTDEEKEISGDDDSSSESEDNLSDLKNDSQSEEEKEMKEDQLVEAEKEELIENREKMEEEKLVEIEKKVETENKAEEDPNKPSDMVKADLLARKKMMEQARKELPYTFQVPDTYEQLQSLFSDRSYEHQAVILERMIKCNHPSLGEGFKDKLANLFAFLLQHLQDIAVSSKENCFALLDCIAPHLYDLAHVSPVNAGRCVAEVLKEKQQDFRSHSRSFPGTSSLIFLKLASLLFPTSDFRHPVTTPALVFMCQMLNQCKIKTARDVAVGLYLATLILEYTVLSKRFSPAVINFLHGVLHMAVPKKSAKLVNITYPGHIGSSARNLLVLEEPLVEQTSEVCFMKAEDLRKTSICDTNFKLRALRTGVKLLLEFCDNLQQIQIHYEIFKPVLRTVKQIEFKNYPKALVEDLNKLVSRIEQMAEKKLRLLVAEKKKPKALRLYEPRIEEVIDGRKRRPMGKERQEREKLLHKYKKEMKGAVREIRRDKSFLAKLKLKQTMKSDMERKQKVKEIFGSASTQQGELRKLKRKK